MSMSETVELKPGDNAPEFELVNQEGERVGLSQLLGQPTILYFYPAAATPSCTTQACEFRDNLAALEKVGYKVLGVSPDKPAKLQKFKAKEGLNFDLLSDPENIAQQAFGAYGKKQMYGKEYMGTIRSTFVIDAGGKIVHALYNVKAKGHLEALRGVLGI